MGYWWPVGEPARCLTYMEIVGQRKAFMAEEGRWRQGVERDAVDEERRAATTLWWVWEVIRGRTAMAEGGHAAEKARVLCQVPAFLDR